MIVTDKMGINRIEIEIKSMPYISSFLIIYSKVSDEIPTVRLITLSKAFAQFYHKVFDNSNRWF